MPNPTKPSTTKAEEQKAKEQKKKRIAERIKELTKQAASLKDVATKADIQIDDDK